jgi:PKD repeat protein
MRNFTNTRKIKRLSITILIVFLSFITNRLYAQQITNLSDKACLCTSIIPDDNQNSSVLAVSNFASYPEYNSSLIYIDISNIPNNATVTSAYLNLYCLFEGDNDVSLRIGRLVHNDSWTETGVTYNNMPYAETPPDFKYFSVSSNTWNSYNVTEFIDAWNAGTYPNNGFQLFTTSNEATATFYNDESSWAPYLIINYTMPTPDITVQNPIVTPTTVYAGDAINVSCDHYCTDGFDETPNVGYYLSTNTTCTTSDTHLGDDGSTICGSDPYDVESEPLTIPAGTSPGTYYICFIGDYLDEVSETNESNNCEYVTITVIPLPTPVASFSGTPTSGCTPLTVNFTDQSSDATSWSWDFGDGSTSTLQNPEHVYNSTDTYTVSLTATNTSGSDTNTKTNYITANSCPAPVSSFTGTPTSDTVPVTVNFTDQSSDATSWLWDFGDGATATEQNPSHIYSNPRNYTVSLTVTNTYGSDTETKINYIDVLPKDVLWPDGFETYFTDSFPSNWVADGNATDILTNFVDNEYSNQGNQSLKLYGTIGGCLGALAYKPIFINESFEIEVAVRNGNESLSGCHPDRAYIGLRKGENWSNPGRAFVLFKGDGTIESGGKTISLGSYSELTWDTVKVKYARIDSTIELSYWINSAYKGSEILPVIEEEDSLNNLDITAQEGSAWFDDITVNNCAVINTHPISQTVCEGSSVSLSVTASGNDLSYQWLKNGENIVDSTNASLNFASVSLNDNADYSVLVSGACGDTITSDTATLSVTLNASISSHPINQTVCEGSNVSFSVTATGTDITYQWQKNGENIIDETTASLSITNANASNTGNYSVLVSDICSNSIASNNAILTVNLNTSISTQPENRSVCEGSNADISVTATGSNLNYQWQKNGVNIINATNSSLYFTSLSLNDAANYRVIVSGECGDPGITNSASLSVNTLPIINLYGDNPVCSGTEKMYITNNNTDYTYEWTVDGGSISSGQNTSQINVTWGNTSNGNISLKETINKTGCEANENYPILINPTPAIQSIFGEDKACINSNLSYKVTNDENSLLWKADGGIISNETEKATEILWKQAGEREVRLTETNSFGCVIESILSVNVADKTLLDIPKIKVKFGSLLIGTNLLDAFASYQWYNEGGLISGATGQFYELPSLLSDEYYLIATDNNTCKAESNHLIFGGSKSYAGILVFPNPASDELSIQLLEQNNETITIRLYNNTGQPVIIKTINNENHIKIINTSDLKNGIYFLNIERDGEIIVREKIIVQH